MQGLAPGTTIRSGDTVATYLRTCGPDILVMLEDGRRVSWSSAASFEVVDTVIVPVEDKLPELEARLQELLHFSEGKYAKLGVTIDTPCTPLPKSMHSAFVQAALGARPSDAIVCRRCTTKLCIRADHIFWGTRSDCQRDMLLRGVARPAGKQVTAVQIAAQIIRLQRRIVRLRHK